MSGHLWNEIKALKWGTPVSELKFKHSCLIHNKNWHQISDYLYFSAVPWKPKSGVYLNDPAGPFVLSFTWVRCKAVMLMLSGAEESFSCIEDGGASFQWLPPGSYKTFHELNEHVEKENYLAQNVYSLNNEFRHRIITIKGTYSYYFSSENTHPDDQPFAIEYLLEKGRGW